eukprot:18626_1
MSASESYDDEEEAQAVVIDNGSSMIKAGFAYDDAPRAIFPCVTGRRQVWPSTNWAVLKHRHTSQFHVGDEVIDKRSVYNLRYPIQKGIVTTFSDYDGMEKIWKHTFDNELRNLKNR